MMSALGLVLIGTISDQDDVDRGDILGAGGKLAAERGHVVGTLLSLSAAGPMFEAYRKRAQELGWTAGPDRFASYRTV